MTKFVDVFSDAIENKPTVTSMLMVFSLHIMALFAISIAIVHGGLWAAMGMLFIVFVAATARQYKVYENRHKK